MIDEVVWCSLLTSSTYPYIIFIQGSTRLTCKVHTLAFVMAVSSMYMASYTNAVCGYVQLLAHRLQGFLYLCASQHHNMYLCLIVCREGSTTS